MMLNGTIPDVESGDDNSKKDTAVAIEVLPGDENTFSTADGKRVADFDEYLQDVFCIVKAETGHDFSSYKTSTVVRRIERRMAMNGIAGMGEYVARLRASGEESHALLRDLLIGVTSFFRNPEAFAALREEVVPRIFADRDPDDPVRIWHACCATGEEVYSTAIIIKEYLQAQRLNFKVQIFATDIDNAALATARSGLYQTAIVEGLDERRLEAFFTRRGNHYQVVKELRDMVVFAHHNLLKDPPYSRLDLLVCRNFLIYLNPQLQKRIIPIFHYALKRDGFLFLGSSETLGNRSDLFTCADKKWNIFIRGNEVRSGDEAFNFNLPPRTVPGTVHLNPSDGTGEPGPAAFVEKILMERYSPPCVVVDERYEVVHFSTRTCGFLELPLGEPTRNILKMAKEELRPPLRAAIHKVIATGEPVTFRGVKVGEGKDTTINILVELVAAPKSERRLAMVIFEPASPPESYQVEATDRALLADGEESCKDRLIRQLEEQLRVTQEQLLATIEQLETSNEGLMLANEELMSNNEEFQSTNEELKTANEELEISKEELRRAKDEWELTFDSVPDLIAILDDRQRIVRVNRAMAQRLYREPEECVGLPCYMAVHGTGEPPEFCPHALTMTDGWEHDAEVHEQALGGDFFVSTTPLKDSRGRITGTVHVARDITARKQAEDERELAVDFLRLVNESTNKEEIVRSAASFFQQQSGCEAVGIRLKEGEDYPYFEAKGFSGDFVLLENRLCDYDEAGELVRDGSGNPLLECMCGNVILGHFNPAKPFFTNEGSFWTNCTTELLADTSEEDRQARTRNRCNGEGYESVALIPLRFGEERLGLLQLNDRRKGLFTPADIALWERLAGYLSVALAKFRAEECLQEKEERWQFAIEGSNDGVWDRNLQTGHVFYSRQWKEMLGYAEDEVGDSVDEWLTRIHGDDLDRVKTELQKHFRGDSPFYFAEYRMQCKDGSHKWILARGKVISRTEDGCPLRFVGTHTDMTERRNLEAQLYQAQKMEAVGQLAGGIAHDFNNILTAIIGFSHLILVKVTEDELLSNYIGQIRGAAEKAADLTQGLLAFSRKQVMMPKVVNLNETVKSLEGMLSRLISENVELCLTTHNEHLTVIADRGKLEQVLMNLATNAKDAMPRGGTLSITTSAITVDSESKSSLGFGAEGTFACISVCDTGTGMDEETRKRIFEPFFTTKEVGKGTGLGLSIVYGIVKQHNGYIDVLSEPEKGTCFRICLPLAEANKTEASPDETIPPTGGTETILLAEDDPAVRCFHRTLLKEWGYQVLEAVDGKEALDRFVEHEADIDLLVFDMVMPKMNGRDVYDAIGKIRPGMKVLFLSGYSAEYLKDSAMVQGNEVLLTKPISPEKLLNRVREALLESTSERRESGRNFFEV